MVTVGDVVGHDLTAAVTMNQIRLLLRARAVDSSSPADLCASVNRLLPIVDTPKLATMIVAFIDVATGHAAFVNAGHPLPIVRTATHVSWLTLPVSLPLGAVREAHYRETVAILPPASTLLLYTDGLVERRQEPPAISNDKLLRRINDLDLSDLDTAIDSLLDIAASDADDDIALMALRRLT
jgi:serine phosphatase RsbU (regulator of sigma subunit)